MPSEDENILKYHSGKKSLKAANVIYMDLESLLIKNQSTQNNPNELYTEKKAIHEGCGYAIKLVRWYDTNKYIRNFHRGKDCIKKLCEDIKTQAIEIINFKEKEMIPLTNDEKVYYEKRKYCHIYRKKVCNDENEKTKYKRYRKARDHCRYTGKFRGAAHNNCNLRCKMQKEIPVVLNNGLYV